MSQVSRLSPSESARLIQLVEVRELRQGEVLLERDAEPAAFYMLFQGELTAVPENEEEAPRGIIAGQYFNVEGMLGCSRSKVNVSAVSDSLLVEVKGRNFFKVLDLLPLLRHELAIVALGSDTSLNSVLAHPLGFTALKV